MMFVVLLSALFRAGSVRSSTAFMFSDFHAPPGCEHIGFLIKKPPLFFGYLFIFIQIEHEGNNHSLAAINQLHWPVGVNSCIHVCAYVTNKICAGFYRGIRVHLFLMTVVL